MGLELDSLGLTAFLTVCATQNFTRAAQALHITQSALSHRIRRFEASIGTKLLMRESSNFSLTGAGHEVLLFGQKKRMLENDLRLKLMANHDDATLVTLRFGAFSSVLRSVIMPSLGAFIREHDNLGVEFFAKEIYELAPLLVSGALDFAVLNYELSHPQFEKVHLFDEENVLIQPKNFKASDTYLDHDPKDQTTLSFFAFHNKSHEQLKRRYCDDIYGIIDGVRLGLGRAVVPLHLVRDCSDIEITDSEAIFTTPVILHFLKLHREDRFHQKIIHALSTKLCGV